MANSKRTVLITGCSEGGMGAELAKEFHKAGLHVLATARDTTKMKELDALGIETLELDVQSEASISACVAKVSRLDILINNAGSAYTMPVVDLNIAEAKKQFDLNVWSYIAATQAFLPLLLKSPKAMIVNHTSIGSDMSLPFQATYNASKAAMSMFTDTLRLELQGFGIAVVNLKTGGVKTNFGKNVKARENLLPTNSIYAPAKEVVESALRMDWLEDQGVPAQTWAKQVVGDLLAKSPRPIIWRGESAWLASYVGWFPFGILDGMVKKMTGLSEVEKIVRKH